MDEKRKNIILFGFMGTGKTAIGKRLASKLGMQFIDMDDLIEEREGKSISKIFAQDGEPYFRRLESEVAREVAGRSGLVVATGGGVVLNYENVRTLESTGIGICLNVSPETIYERVRRQTHRPLLQVEDPLQRIRDMLASRREAYSRVSHQIECTDDDFEENVRRILDLVQSVDRSSG